MHAKVLFTPIPLHKYRNPTRRTLLSCFDSIFNIQSKYRRFRVSNQIESFKLIFKVWMMVNEKDSIHLIQSDERLNSILIIDPKHGGFTSFCSNFQWITDYGTYQPHHLHFRPTPRKYDRSCDRKCPKSRPIFRCFRTFWTLRSVFKFGHKIVR